MKSASKSYADAGVDVTAGYKAVELMKKHVVSTHTPGVLTDIGGFGGLFEPDLTGISAPVLVSGTDGVGTKLKLAFMMDKHDTVGIDCVAMCANDVICTGASPLFFLDYIAMGKNIPEKTAAVVSGVAEGCRQSGCALIGGETAEMPGFYPEDEYDLAGFCVGIADKSRIIDGNGVVPGDAIIGLASSGVHSNGFSLVRKLLAGSPGDLKKTYPGFDRPIGEVLITPTRIYVNAVKALLPDFTLKALSHITGGGFIENIPRMLPQGVSAYIKPGTWPILPVFDLLQKTGDIPVRDMYNTFNMGIGMAVVLPAEEAERAVGALSQAGYPAYIIGEVVSGDSGIAIEGVE